MALSIKNKEYEATARELARVTGKTITEAGLLGLKRELERQKTIHRAKQGARQEFEATMEFVRDLQRKYAALPNTNTLTDDEILGYDEYGAPTK
jgi:antitoxin VapB